MFRAAVLSIVLALAAGQNTATLLCGIWCHPGEGMADQCEQQGGTTSPAVTADDCKVDSDGIVFVREDPLRTGSAPTVEAGVLVPPFALTPPASGRLSRYLASDRPLLELRPLVLALRI